MRKNNDQILYTNSFAATIRTKPGSVGIKSLMVKNVRWYQYQLNKFKEGENVTLVVTNKKPKRTEQQNRYYWGVYLPIIAKESGEEQRNKKYIDLLHERFAGELLTEGIYEIFGKKVRLRKSTAQLSISEFCNYIMDIERLTGIEAPPTEMWGLDPLPRPTPSYPQE